MLNKIRDYINKPIDIFKHKLLGPFKTAKPIEDITTKEVLPVQDRVAQCASPELMKKLLGCGEPGIGVGRRGAENYYIEKTFATIPTSEESIEQRKEKRNNIVELSSAIIHVTGRALKNMKTMGRLLSLFHSMDEVKEGETYELRIQILKNDSR